MSISEPSRRRVARSAWGADVLRERNVLWLLLVRLLFLGAIAYYWWAVSLSAGGLTSEPFPWSVVGADAMRLFAAPDVIAHPGPLGRGTDALALAQARDQRREPVAERAGAADDRDRFAAHRSASLGGVRPRLARGEAPRLASNGSCKDVTCSIPVPAAGTPW